MSEEWKERELAGHIMDKHLQRLCMKAILKGYDILTADNLPASFEDMTLLRIKKGDRNILQLQAGRPRSSSVEWVDICSKPETFEHAKNTLDALESLIDLSPRPPHPELNEQNLLQLRSLLTESKKSDGRVFFSGTMRHDFKNGFPFTNYRIDKNYYDDGEIMEIKKALQSTEKVLAFLKRRTDEAGETDWGMLPHMVRCNNYLVFLEENVLLREHELHMRGEKGLLYAELLPSLSEHMKALSPSSEEIERTTGNISKLKKDEQRKFLEMHTTEPVSLPSFGNVPATEFALSLSWDEKIDHMKGALKNWVSVLNDTSNAAVLLKDGILSRMKCDIRLGDDIHRGVLQIAHFTSHIPPLPREILSSLAFLALHRTLVKGGRERAPVSESISSVSRDVAAAICGTFKAHLNNDEEDPVELLDIRKKMKVPPPGRITKKALTQVNMPGTMSIETARKALSNVARGLSEGLIIMREQAADTHELVLGSLREARKQVDLVTGWTYTLSLEPQWRKDTEIFFKLNHSPDLVVNFKNAMSAPVLTEKLCEAIFVIPSEGVVNVTPALASLIEDEGKKVGDLLRKDLEDFAREVRHRQSEMKDHYYEVLSRDFPTEFFEGYVRPTLGM